LAGGEKGAYTMAAPGEKDLARLLATLKVTTNPETFVFLTFPSSEAPPPTLFQQMSFREKEGLAVITTLASALEHGIKDITFPCRMITCEVHSSLETVGFMAKTTDCLTNRGIGANCVAGYFHDHLFVEGRVEDAVAALEEMVKETRGKEPQGVSR